MQKQEETKTKDTKQIKQNHLLFFYVNVSMVFCFFMYPLNTP